MKRCLFKLVLFLLLGAIINVAVAWGLIVWMPITGHEMDIRETYWPISVPLGWPPPNEGHRVWGYGWDMLNPITVNLENNSLGTLDIYGVGVWTAGLPARSLKAEWRHAHPPGEWRWVWRKPAKLSWINAQPDRLLPLRPIWPGFAINTIIYAVILWLPFTPFTARRFIRRKRGLCIKCGYDLRGDFYSGCPECGWGREAEA